VLLLLMLEMRQKQKLPPSVHSMPPVPPLDALVLAEVDALVLAEVDALVLAEVDALVEPRCPSSRSWRCSRSSLRPRLA